MNSDCSTRVNNNSHKYELNVDNESVGYINIKTGEIVLQEFDSFYKTPEEFREEIFNTVQLICVDNLLDIHAIFPSKIIEWLGDNGGPDITDGDLVFEKYSTKKSVELAENKKNLAKCQYEEYDSIGGWLVYKGVTRDYCEDRMDKGSICSSLVINQSKFNDYLNNLYNTGAISYEEYNKYSRNSIFSLRNVVGVVVLVGVVFVLLWFKLR